MNSYQISAFFNGEIAFCENMKAEDMQDAKERFIEKFRFNFVQESKWTFTVNEFINNIPEPVLEFGIGKGTTK